MLFIHSSIDGHFGCFHLLATVNNAAMDINIQTPLWDPDLNPFSHIPRSGILTQKLDYKEVCVSKNWCFWIVVLEKTLESPVDSKEVKPVNSKENPPWILIGRTDAEVQAQVPIFCPHDAKSQLVAAVHGITKSQTQFSDWTKTTIQK